MVRHNAALRRTIHTIDQQIAIERNAELVALVVPGDAPDDAPPLPQRVLPLAHLRQHVPAEVQDARLPRRHQVPQSHAALAAADGQHELHGGVDGEVDDAVRGGPERGRVAAGPPQGLRDRGLDGAEERPVARARHGDGRVLRGRQQLRPRREREPRHRRRVVQQRAELAVARVLEDAARRQGGEHLVHALFLLLALALALAISLFLLPSLPPFFFLSLGRMRRYVVYVYALVVAT